MSTRDAPKIPDAKPKECRHCWRRIEGSNLYWQYRGKSHTKHPSCRSCRNENARKAYSRQRLREYPDSSPYDGTGEGIEIMSTTSGNGKNAPWNLHKTKPEAREVWQRFQIELDQTRTPCHESPELYTDYDDPRFPEESLGLPMPTAVQAAALCGDCPLLALCKEFAHKERPDFGTWGGERWQSGKVVR